MWRHRTRGRPLPPVGKTRQNLSAHIYAKNGERILAFRAKVQEAPFFV